MKTKHILKLVASILLCQLACFVGSLFTTSVIPGGMCPHSVFISEGTGVSGSCRLREQ